MTDDKNLNRLGWILGAWILGVLVAGTIVALIFN